MPVPPLIVGAGPTGLAAALFLSHRGIPARIVDRAPAPARHSRALGVNPRTLELLEPTGVTDRMLAEGWRLRRGNLWRNGRRIGQVKLDGIRHRFPFLLVLSQERSEALLTDALAERGIAPERGVALTALELDSEAAVATLSRPGDDGGGSETVRAPLLLGADGAHSTAREAAGIGFPGAAFPEAWTLADMRLETPLDPNEAHVFLPDGGLVFLLRVSGDLWRVIGNLPEPLAELPAGSMAGDTVWTSQFHIAHKLAARLREGPLCLAGDAAHIHSPMGARGMNLGVEDAYVWAALAAAGRTADYERLRRPVMEEVVRRLETVTQLPRGRVWWARAMRRALPLIGPILLPRAAARVVPFMLGVDHGVKIR